MGYRPHWNLESVSEYKHCPVLQRSWNQDCFLSFWMATAVGLQETTKKALSQMQAVQISGLSCRKPPLAQREFLNPLFIEIMWLNLKNPLTTITNLQTTLFSELYLLLMRRSQCTDTSIVGHLSPKSILGDGPTSFKSSINYTAAVNAEKKELWVIMKLSVFA